MEVCRFCYRVRNLSVSMVGDPPAPSQRVIHAVADATGRPPLELPPLYETVDPDALDAIAESWTHGVLRFSYAGCTVTVESPDEVHVTREDLERDGGGRERSDLTNE